MKYMVVRTYLSDSGTIELQSAFNNGWQYKDARVLVQEHSIYKPVIEYILYKKETNK